MMASPDVAAPARRNSAPLDLGLAAFTAGAVAFATWAMPAGLFGDLVAATGLPNFVAAAQPPLGATARIAAIGAGAVTAFAFVWLLLRALSRPPQAISQPLILDEEAEDVDEEPLAPAPRVRRHDAHPDAPAPRPLFAVRDLGEPAVVEEAPVAAVEEAPAPPPAAGPNAPPLWMVTEDSEADFGPVPEPKPFVAETEVREVQAEPLAEHLPEPTAEEPAEEEAPWPMEAVEDEPLREEESISRLMARLEGGLERKFGHAEPRPPEPVAPPAATDAAGHRLRSALADLQKLSSRA